MALGDNYADLTAIKSYLSIDDTGDDTELTDALSTASRAVEKFCHRQFNKATSATARVYRPDNSWFIRIDDFWTTSNLVIATDEGDDGVYETTWTAADYQLEPLNGVVDGEIGWPYSKVRTVGVRCFPRWSRASVQVTAQWGWNAVPAAVKQAALILAAEVFKAKDAPFGVAGFGDFGVVRVRDNPMAAKKLMPYVRDVVMVA